MSCEVVVKIRSSTMADSEKKKDKHLQLVWEMFFAQSTFCHRFSLILIHELKPVYRNA